MVAPGTQDFMTAFFALKQKIALSRMLQHVKQISSLIASKCLASPVIEFNTTFTKVQLQNLNNSQIWSPLVANCTKDFMTAFFEFKQTIALSRMLSSMVALVKNKFLALQLLRMTNTQNDKQRVFPEMAFFFSLQFNYLLKVSKN